MNICIFEDDHYTDLFPLTYFRPVFELRCGASLLWEKFKAKFPGARFSFYTREYLVPGLKKKYPQAVFNPDLVFDDDTLFINGRWLYKYEDIDLVESVYFLEEQIVYAFLTKESMGDLKADDLLTSLAALGNRITTRRTDVKLIRYPWDLVYLNSEALVSDFPKLFEKGIRGRFSDKAEIVGDKNAVAILEGAEVQPFVVIDTTHAPVIIDKNAIVYPFSRIEGPAYIGQKSLIVGGKIREGTTLGPVCCVGGEVEETVIQGYTNKWHDGFLGHAYVGEWVNIGALATNSDMKNNYSNIKVPVNAKLTDTKNWKAGAFIGDHSKLGIGTLLNTGSVVGVCTNIFASKGLMPPKYVSSFCWGSGAEFVEYRLEEAVKTAKSVFSKRNVTQTEADIELMNKVFALTAQDRKTFLKR